MHTAPNSHTKKVSRKRFVIKSKVAVMVSAIFGVGFSLLCYHIFSSRKLLQEQGVAGLIPTWMLIGIVAASNDNIRESGFVSPEYASAHMPGHLNNLLYNRSLDTLASKFYLARLASGSPVAPLHQMANGTNVDVMLFSAIRSGVLTASDIRPHIEISINNSSDLCTLPHYSYSRIVCASCDTVQSKTLSLRPLLHLGSVRNVRRMSDEGTWVGVAKSSLGTIVASQISITIVPDISAREYCARLGLAEPMEYKLLIRHDCSKNVWSLDK